MKKSKDEGDSGAITISGSSTGEKVDFTQKIGYQEEAQLRARFMKDKEVIDEDHLYVRKGKTTGRLRGRLKDNINKIKNSRQNAATKNMTEINTGSNLMSIEEENITEQELDDITKQSISFKGHYDLRTKKAVEVYLKNTQASY